MTEMSLDICPWERGKLPLVKDRGFKELVFLGMYVASSSGLGA